MNKPLDIGIVCGHPREMRAVASILKDAARERFSLFNGYTGMLEDCSCVVIGSGMGADRAYLATKQIIPLFEPRLIMDFGVAAGLRSDLSPGDVIAAEKVKDLSRLIKAWEEEAPFFTRRPNLAGNLEAEDISLTKERLKPLGEIQGLKQAVVGSADFTLRNSLVGEELLGRGVDVFDNETFWVVKAAVEADVPCVSVRAVSDSGDEKALGDFHQHFKSVIKKALGYLREICGVLKS